MEYPVAECSLSRMDTSPEAYRLTLKLAEKLRDARTDAGLTQEEAADALGVSQNWISKSEIAERTMKFLDVERISRLYGKPITFFLTME